ncbi:5446_t:CDS:2, partial [Racocetra persica]
IDTMMKSLLDLLMETEPESIPVNTESWINISEENKLVEYKALKYSGKVCGTFKSSNAEKNETKIGIEKSVGMNLMGGSFDLGNWHQTGIGLFPLTLLSSYL